ncbi:hypothetical protein [Prescottella equi]|uniref:hypothetical protein n=1 Tax=Rhodococcus hoagii TaxID=43767 RepID=UPI001584A676|nr:hypothetical protein [Prescottella equi]
MQVGDRVRIRPGGTSIFTITEGPDEDGKMLIQPVDDAPGAYPFPMKPENLVAAD